jgi:ceramide glucosyltransferase
MMHFAIRITEIVAILGCLSSCIYYLFCLGSAAAFLREPQARAGLPSAQTLPPVSVLKPLKGADPEIYECFRSHCLQDYPEYEIIFGVSDPEDPVVASVKHLQREFPERAIRLVVCPEKLGTNIKVSSLEQMMQTARHEYLIVNDSDIRVERDYLRRIVSPLNQQQIGMVTCLYRGIAACSLGSRLESLGISTDFSAGVLVARQMESGLHFGLGSTLAFRRADLERVGGFRSIVDFLADDYELGRRVTDLGLQVELSRVVVETHLPAYDLQGYLSHQLRWARGMRDSRPGGYIGLISTYGLMWAMLTGLVRYRAPWAWALFATVLLLRLAVAFTVGKAVLHDRQTAKFLWLLPVRDLLAVAVWMVSFAGHTVTWRGDRFALKHGRLTRI